MGYADQYFASLSPSLSNMCVPEPDPYHGMLTPAPDDETYEPTDLTAAVTSTEDAEPPPEPPLGPPPSDEVDELPVPSAPPQSGYSAPDDEERPSEVTHNFIRSNARFPSPPYDAEDLQTVEQLFMFYEDIRRQPHTSVKILVQYYIPACRQVYKAQFCSMCYNYSINCAHHIKFYDIVSFKGDCYKDTYFCSICAAPLYTVVDN